MVGYHFTQLYIKLEYSFTNNTHLAEKFFSQALEVALNDSFVLHERDIDLRIGYRAHVTCREL